jgi:hypothetical protein
MNESPLFTRTHDLLLWLIPEVQKFPRVHRFGLAERIQCLALDFQDSIVAAGKSKGAERVNWLHQADILLEQLRSWMRITREMGLITVRQYEHAVRLVNEVGRLLGGWIKQTG